jgi:hypothetical protein
MAKRVATGELIVVGAFSLSHSQPSLQVKVIKSRPVMAKRVATGELIVVGAFYEKRSGMVDFIRGENDVLQSASGDRPGGRSSPITEEEIVICNTPRR